MNILNKLTLKHLKMNKKRTLVTIIGITLSTALMVGIGLLISTFLTTERINAEESHGSHHLSINDITKNQYETLKRNIKVSKAYYYNKIGFAKIDSKNSFKPYIFITEGTTDFLKSLKLVEGRLPQNKNEIVISSHMLSDGSLNVKVGDTVTFDVGSRFIDGEDIGNSNTPIPREWNGDTVNPVEEILENTKPLTYKIVGIVKRTNYEDYEAAGYMAFSLNDTTPEVLDIFVELKNPQDTYDTINTLASALNIDKDSITPNSGLLFYYGATKYENVNNTFLPLILIALSVISVGCIIVIYNSFAISTMERKKSFGLYSSIGATSKQIKKTVLFEAFIVGLIGIILGILGGFLGIYIVVEVLNVLLKNTIQMKLIFSVELMYLMIPLIFMCLVILISAYLPAKRSSKVTPIEAIRGNDDIKISRKEVKTSKLISKVFGIEGELARKNMKRNKKKYRVTIISLFISIVMFNTFTSFLGYIVKTSDAVDYTDYDMGITLIDNKETILEDVNTLKSKYSIDEERIILNKTTITIKNFAESEYTTMWQDIGPDYSDEEKLPVELIVLQDYDYNKLTNEEAILLNKKYSTSYDNGNRKTIETEILKGSRYSIEVLNDDESTSNINAVTSDKVVFGLKNTLYSNRPALIISESTYLNKFNKLKEYDSYYMFNSKDYKKISADFDDKKINLKSDVVEYYSPAIENANVKNVILAIKILFYGFIALVVLIGVTSVINTINTSISLRRKEFAMLRSVGLTPRGFNKILFFESLFFGLKSLIYGIPVSIGINALISMALQDVFKTSMIIPWKSLGITIIGVFIIVMISMNYASKKIKRENILEALREENI